MRSGQTREDQQKNPDITRSETRTHEIPPRSSEAKSLSEQNAMGKARLPLEEGQIQKTRCVAFWGEGRLAASLPVESRQRGGYPEKYNGLSVVLREIQSLFDGPA